MLTSTRDVDGAADEFWPPAVDTNKLGLGAFIVKFGFRKRRKTEGINVRSHDLRNKIKVISLPKECLESRMATPRD